MRGRIPSVVRRVFTLCTPGTSVGVVVTEAGIALNPKHKHYEELREDLEKARVKTTTIEKLCEKSLSMTGVPKPVACTDKTVAIVEYRDGTVIDVMRQKRSINE